MIKVKNLTKIYRSPVKQKNFIKDLLFRKYKEIKALDSISFEIGEGELVGFIGPNGAGKTTTLKILSGILYPTTGEVTILGRTPFKKEPDYLKQISFIMGNRNQLIWDLPATDTFKLHKAIYEIDDKPYGDMVNDLATKLKCLHLLKKPVKMLSLGERMKMELIAGLIHRPKVIFFDEPTIGLDIFSQETIRDFIKSYQKTTKATIILTSHYLEDVKRLAERLLIINKGQLLYDGSLETILEEYSKEKRVSVVLEHEVDQKELDRIGKQESFEFPKVVFRIPRTILSEKISLITKHLPYADMSIEDETIEEVIKMFFKKQA